MFGRNYGGYILSILIVCQDGQPTGRDVVHAPNVVTSYQPSGLPLPRPPSDQSQKVLKQTPAAHPAIPCTPPSHSTTTVLLFTWLKDYKASGNSVREFIPESFICTSLTSMRSQRDACLLQVSQVHGQMGTPPRNPQDL